MKIILFDDSTWHNLLPLTYTKPISHLRIGIFKIIEKWEHNFGTSCLVFCEAYLRSKFSYSSFPKQQEYLAINSSVLPNKQIVHDIKALHSEEMLMAKGKIIAFKSANAIEQVLTGTVKLKKVTIDDCTSINNLWDLYLLNATEIRKDIALVNKISTNISIGEGVVLNEKEGPIYLGSNVTLMDGALLRGPLAICDGAVIKMGAKIYGGTTIGPKCTVGGDIKMY